MFRASLFSSSGERTIQRTACGVCLVVLTAVVQSWDTSCVHCLKDGIRIPTFTQCTQLLSQLYTTATNTTRHSPHAVFCIVSSPDDENNDARNMLS